MLKYRGQYRVIYETDERTGKPLEFAYIPCRIRKGASICRHEGDILNVFVPGAKAVSKILNEYSDIFKPFQIGGTEGTFLFPESSLAEVAWILKPYVKGKNKNPKPKRQVTISDERKLELSIRMKQLHANVKIIREKPRKAG